MHDCFAALNSVVHSGMFKSRLWHAFAALILFANAHAASLVVFPFESDDPRLGTAVAHAIAEGLDSGFEVYGPAVAPSLVPPFLVDGGFYNPAGFYADLAGPGQAALLRSGSGAEVAVNGLIYDTDGLLVLEMNLAHAGGLDQITLQVTSGNPGDLAARAAALTARALGKAGIPEVEEIALDGVAGLRASAIYDAGLPGGLDSALLTLHEPLLADDPYSVRLREAIESVQAGTDDGDPVLLAALSLNSVGLDEARSARYFENLTEGNLLPAFWLWRAMLKASSGDSVAAESAFEAAATYPYGVAARHAWNMADSDTVAAELPRADAPSLITYSVLARSMGDTLLEKQALRQLTRVDPWQAWAFERLSFIAFDEDEALDAGQALAVAVRLQPDSDLYWTNLGWAQYLLGLLDQSEQSSIRATLLASQQYIAHYNLGLVRAVTGRLGEAIEAYDVALRFDPSVDDAAIEDLQNALRLYPSEPAVHFSLAYLLEAAGQRSAAASQYGAYLGRVSQGDFAERAQARMEVLLAPPPELQLPGGVRVFLGAIEQTDAELQAGDPLRPSFEVYTPGDSLPVSLSVEFSLESEGEQLESAGHELTLPPQTVGFVIDGLSFRLPADLAPGDYDLTVTIRASEDRQVSESASLSVAELSDPLRAVYGYGIILQSIETGGALFDRQDLGNWSSSASVLQNELLIAHDAAEEILPRIDNGRFAGLSGGAAFEATTDDDLADFLRYIAHPDLDGASFVFVDTYAQWIIDGSPTE